ncbi:hypothetical protein OG883_34470 [Streptomyces sp. NBC_01142]|uniref:hypothetical protein n=1 Tax=Streptomyces sp. NBC_01142 TaxID=2975865 RepID=UPI002251DD68|nr:hypothetical protein [Streptomyces sp. NBC_01142]MCX4824872.1 hypothetical protein [Streptomyces sp. NBC_01142]
MSKKSQQDAAAWVVDATAKLKASPAPDAWTVANADLAKTAARTAGTTPAQIADAARNEQDLTLDDYYAEAVRNLRHIEALLRDIDEHAPAGTPSRLDQVRGGSNG